jgi:hypothetical protein
VQRGIETVTFDGEFSVYRDIVLPRQGTDPLEELVKGGGGERPQLHQHPGAAAQVDVQAGDVGKGALAVDATVFGADVLQPQALDLVGHQALQPKQARNRQSHMRVLLIIQRSIKDSFFPSIPEPAGLCNAPGGNYRGFSARDMVD